MAANPFTGNRLSAAFAAVALALVLLTGSPGAVAQSLDQWRAQGLVGERYDGYAVVRQSNAPAGARQTVESVNRQRAQIYAKRAAEQKVPKEQVGKLYARQIADSAPKGTWFLLESGQWRQK